MLTGHRDAGRHLARIDGRELRLSKRLFYSLCCLVKARIGSTIGFVVLNKLAVFRLREEIDRTLGRKDAGKELIRTGSFQGEYRLATDVEVLRDSTFEELPSPHFVAKICKSLPEARPA